MGIYRMEIIMNKRRWMGLGIAETIVFVVLIVLLAVPTVNKTFNVSDMEYMLGQIRDDSIYTDSELSSRGWFVVTPRLGLGYGLYKVSVEYESTSENSFLYFISGSEQASEVRNIDKYYADNLYLKAS